MSVGFYQSLLSIEGIHKKLIMGGLPTYCTVFLAVSNASLEPAEAGCGEGCFGSFRRMRSFRPAPVSLVDHEREY
jgi:hypothetical protein